MVINLEERVVSTNRRELSRPRLQDLKSVLCIQADLTWIMKRFFLTHDPQVRFSSTPEMMVHFGHINRDQLDDLYYLLDGFLGFFRKF